MLKYKDSPVTSLQPGHGWDNWSWMGHDKSHVTKKNAEAKRNIYALIYRGIGPSNH